MSNTTPKAAYLRAVRAENWKVAGALAELVDNSFGSARGDAMRCDITWEPAKRRLTVFDNGKGMSPNITRIFTLGDAIGRANGDIGFFGAGGTKAILWLADIIKVWTLRKDGYVNRDVVDWDKQIDVLNEYPEVSEVWEKANANNTPVTLLEAGHGTLIEILLSESRSGFYTSNAIRDLSEIFAPAGRNGRRLTWKTTAKNGISQTLGDPFEILDPDHTVFLDGYVAVGDDYLGVRGEVGLVPGLSKEKSRVAIGYGHRVIFRTTECFKSPDKSESYQVAGVAGYLDLRDGWQPFLTVTKDEIAHSEVRKELMAWIFKQIRPILKLAEESDLQLVLDDISLSLERRLEPSTRRKGDEGAGGPRPGTGHSVIDIDPSTGDAVNTPRSAKSPESKIPILPLDNAAMDGRLCFADSTDDQVGVWVNKDHPYVQEAMKAEPINRMALVLLVTREIADLLEKDEDLRQRTFRTPELEVIDGVESATGATIQRLLIDRVREPKGEVA